MTLSSLTPLHRVHPVRVASVISKDRGHQPAAPASAAVQPSVEQLTVNDVHGPNLSTATVNALLPHNPALVAELMIQAYLRARGELPTPMSSLSPVARAICLAGEKARGRELSDADAEFLSSFCEEHWPSS